MMDTLWTFIASWPWVRIQLVVELVAVVVAFAVCSRLIIPPIARGIDLQMKRRTDKAKEKYADGLMSVSNAIESALAIGIFVFPSTAYIQALMSGMDPLAPLRKALNAEWLTWPSIWLIAVFYLGPFVGATLLRRQALNLYDDIARKS